MLGGVGSAGEIPALTRLGLNHIFNLSTTGGDPLVQLDTHFGGVNYSTSPQSNDVRYINIAPMRFEVLGDQPPVTVMRLVLAA
jgi:hypothetical protein